MQVMTSNSATEPLQWREIADRPLRNDEIRVTVRAAGVNPVDWKMRQGDLLGIAQKLIGPPGSLVCGIDFAGDIIEIGSGVTDLKVGDRVVGGTDFSRKQYGSYAKTVQVRADQVAVLPGEVSYEDAACLPVAASTAQTALYDLGHLPVGGRALILGASGGVGHFAAQLAAYRGATAVGVCSTRNVAFVEGLGAIALDYAPGDVPARALALGPYDVVVDAVGTASYPIAMCQKLLKKGGKHIMVMPKAMDYFSIFMPGPTLTVLGRANRATLTPLVADVAAGKLKVAIHQRFSMDQANEAHEMSRGGKVVGKLVLLA